MRNKESNEWLGWLAPTSLAAMIVAVILIYQATYIEPQPEPPPPWDERQALASVTANELKEIVAYLASDASGGRKPGTEGSRIARDYILNRLHGGGLPTMQDRFDSGTNIYAWLEGTELPDEIVVVGAHYDHIGRRGSRVNYGADDNASGTAAVLEIADALAGSGGLRRTVVFQLYDAEEMGLLGSRHYVRNPKFPRGNPSMKNHVAMLNFDMVGRHGKASGFRASFSKLDVGPIARSLYGQHPIAVDVSQFGSGGSDHANFLRSGVPTVWCFTGDHRDYHTPTDTADKIDYKGLTDVARYGVALTIRLANDPAAPGRVEGSVFDMPTRDHFGGAEFGEGKER